MNIKIEDLIENSTASDMDKMILDLLYMQQNLLSIKQDIEIYKSKYIYSIKNNYIDDVNNYIASAIVSLIDIRSKLTSFKLSNFHLSKSEATELVNSITDNDMDTLLSELSSFGNDTIINNNIIYILTHDKMVYLLEKSCSFLMILIDSYILYIKSCSFRSEYHI